MRDVKFARPIFTRRWVWSINLRSCILTILSIKNKNNKMANETAGSQPATHLQIASKYRPDLDAFIETYKTIHQNPELSRQESNTAKLTAKHLRSLECFEVIEGIGGHSTVGVLRNGSGKTVLMRADMDALPIFEETELPYASQHRMADVVDCVEKPVMHACGHDMHTVCLMAAASCLAAAREHWSARSFVSSNLMRKLELGRAL